jgi:UDP-2,3-diacylglucosamine pyrophosphatase LpxH
MAAVRCAAVSAIRERQRRVFVISDLHLGGRPRSESTLGFQICNAYRELVEFVDWIRSQREGDCELELVVNGDIVDFLAEDDFDAAGVQAEPWTGDDDAAVLKFDRIVARTRGDSERGFFDALRDFVKDGHRVTFILGNHDVELSLPAVRRRLESIVGFERVRFVYDGEAYSIGRVLIEHGNRYDRWNILDFDQLREERSVRSRGLPRHADALFRPPSGTLLVTWFMNPLKARYRFIDLLKPETGAVLPLLLALEPDLDLGLRALLKVAPIVRGVAARHHGKDGMPARAGELGGPGGSRRPISLDELLAEELGAEDARLFEDPSAAAQDGELGGASDLWRALVDNAVRLRALGESLSHLVAIRNAATDDHRRARLSAALTALASKDRSFELTHEAANYLDAAGTLCRTGRFDVVVFGHTHLPKQVDLSESIGRQATYLNTGTWADVIRLDHLPRPIDNGFIDAVQTNQLDEYTVRYLTYAEIVLEGDTPCEAAIRSFCGAQRPREAPLVPAP